MHRTFIRVLTLAVALMLTTWTGRAQNAPPRLVVLLVVDQFPSEYIDLYSSQWQHGLKRLLDTGAVFTNAAYPYGVTVTCAGHASIGSGRTPSHHGMIGNAWYDRAESKSVQCTEDTGATAVAFGGAEGKEHHSPRRMLTRSFADELRAQAPQPPTIVSLSLKARSAIGMAGHAGPKTYVIWTEETGVFTTSTAYAPAPWPEFQEFMSAGGNPPRGTANDVWSLMRPADTYRFVDDGLAEAAPTGWTKTFPHPLARTPGAIDAGYFINWQRSPESLDYLQRLAGTAVDRLRLGQTGATDMLAVSFSGVDIVGHPFGPRSFEVQDMLARLDVAIGRLLDDLDTKVGRDRYVVGFSSDHGVAMLPEQAAAAGRDAGRVPTAQVTAAVTKAVLDSVGIAQGVRNASYPNIYFTDAALAAINQRPEARKAVADAALQVPGVAKVYWPDQLASTSATNDPILTAMRKSYIADRNGDVMFVSKENWLSGATGTNHGTPYAYDQRVPVIFMGAGIKSGKYRSAASPLDLAPTFARLTRISLEADGRVLTDALR
jgi:predicted AlkP superfamily pyrophosphatase or phosphodiesterase